MKFKQMNNRLRVALILNIIACILLGAIAFFKIIIFKESEQTLTEDLAEKIRYYIQLYQLIICPISLILTILYMVGVVKSKKLVGIVAIFANLIFGIIILVVKTNNEKNEDCELQN